jgi:hypothetical protein
MIWRVFMSSQFSALCGNVGVFYVIDGQVHTRSTDVKLFGRSSGLLSFSTHFSFWFEELRHVRPEWKDVDDSYFPRGRVYYVVSAGKYRALMDSCIPQKADDKIKKAFGLDGLDGLDVEMVRGPDPASGGTDHYRCSQCDPKNRHKVL